MFFKESLIVLFTVLTIGPTLGWILHYPPCNDNSDNTQLPTGTKWCQCYGADEVDSDFPECMFGFTDETREACFVVIKDDNIIPGTCDMVTKEQAQKKGKSIQFAHDGAAMNF